MQTWQIQYEERLAKLEASQVRQERMLSLILENQLRQDNSFENIKSTMHTFMAELKKINVEERSGDGETTMMGHQCKAVLPLQNHEDLIEFERGLDETRDDVMSYMMSVGGKTAKKMVANLVSCFYDMKLQTDMTWKGIRGLDGYWSKKPLMVTKVPYIIAGKTYKTSGKKHVENICISYFRCCPAIIQKYDHIGDFGHF